ncbi:MAG: acyl-CoA dehydrogenase family protein [Acidimicrobiales bacterium]
MADDDLEEIRAELRGVARHVVTERSPMTSVRGLLDDPLGFDEDLWATAAELGWLGLELHEDYGGSDMSFRELGVVLDELGRGVVPLPFLATVVLGAGALVAAGSEAQREQWLPAVAQGERRLTVALGGRTGGYGLDAMEVTAAPLDGGWRLDGTAAFVPDAHAADAVVVAVVAPEGPSLVLVPRSADGVAVDVTPAYDQTRRLCEVRLDGVLVEPSAVVGAPGRAGPVIDWLIERAGVALALDSHGGARRVMELSVDYAKERVQFDRPIGSFQAVKHRCADMFLAVEAARVAAETGARELPSSPGSPSSWASIAKSYAADAYARVAGAAVEVHGGIGFTWEHDLHLFLKRAKLSQAWFGSSAWHRERLVAALGDGSPDRQAV